MLRIVEEKKVSEHLTPSRAIASQLAAFTWSREVPDRIILTELLSGPSLFKPCALRAPDGKTIVGAKIVSVRPSNAALTPPLPTVPATILLLDDATGALTTLIDGTLLTAIRTAAGSALATQRLRSGKTTSSLVVFGAGLQGLQHARHILHSFPSITSVKIMNRSEPRALAACASLAAEFAKFEEGEAKAFECVLLSDRPGVRAAVEGADVICLCTNSSEPLFEAAWLKEGCHINGVGSYTPDMQEVDTGTVGRCEKVVLDSFEALPVGDIAKALDAGAVKREELFELAEILQGEQQGSGPEGCTFFKSVGLASQDIAAAGFLLDALEAGEGVTDK